MLCFRVLTDYLHLLEDWKVRYAPKTPEDALDDRFVEACQMHCRIEYMATEAEQKEFMKAFIERIEMFPEKRKDGSWIKKIVFNFPVPVGGEEVKELPLETKTTVETVVLLSRTGI